MGVAMGLAMALALVGSAWRRSGSILPPMPPVFIWTDDAGLNECLFKPNLPCPATHAYGGVGGLPAVQARQDAYVDRALRR